MKSFQKSPGVKDCCKDDANLEEIRERPDLVVYVCRVCGCRHKVLTAEPGKFGVVMTK